MWRQIVYVPWARVNLSTYFVAHKKHKVKSQGEVISNGFLFSQGCLQHDHRCCLSQLSYHLKMKTLGWLKCHCFPGCPTFQQRSKTPNVSCASPPPSPPPILDCQENCRPCRSSKSCQGTQGKQLAEVGKLEWATSPTSTIPASMTSMSTSTSTTSTAK